MKFFKDLRTEDFKSMTKKKKAEHIYEYYKVHIYVLIFFIITSLILLSELFLTSNDDLYFVTLPNTTLTSIQTSIILTDFDKVTDGDYSVNCNIFSPIVINADGAFSKVGSNTTETLVADGNCDVYFILQTDINTCAGNALNEYMTEEDIEKYAKSDQSIRSGNDIRAIRLNDLPFYEKYLYDCETELYLCVSQNIPNEHEAALRDFIEFVLD